MSSSESTVHKVRDLDDGARTLLVVTRPDGAAVRYVVARRAQRGALASTPKPKPSSTFSKR